MTSPPLAAPLTRALRLAAAPVVAGAAALAYGALHEVSAFTLRRVEVPVLAPGSRPLRVLQFSDVHLVPDQHAKLDWLASLASLDPDLVVDTGDNLAHPDAVVPLLEALGGLLDRPGVFVMGSNDYAAPGWRNPVRYLLPDRGHRVVTTAELPWRDLRDAFTARGWVDLDNARASLRVDGRTVELTGVDDPHVWRDRYGDVAGPVDPGADLGLAVTHSPEPRVLDAMAGDGFPLLLAGHTHGGQLRVPGYGAVVTNCGIDRARARGLSRYGGSWLHVSAGLGTSPYYPVRFACRPEATLLTLVAP